MRAFFAVTQRDGGINDPQMGESLWKISQRVTGVGIDLLGEKAHVVSIGERGFEGLVRFGKISTARQNSHLQQTTDGGRPLISTFAFLPAVNHAWPRTYIRSAVC